MPLLERKGAVTDFCKRGNCGKFKSGRAFGEKCDRISRRTVKGLCAAHRLGNYPYGGDRREPGEMSLQRTAWGEGGAKTPYS